LEYNFGLINIHLLLNDTANIHNTGLGLNLTQVILP